MQKKIPIAILGATGSVGQKFIQILENHPWFEISAITASEKNTGKEYADAVEWTLPTNIPHFIKKMKLRNTEAPLPAVIVFSALDASVAGPIETDFADKGYFVISNAKNHRYDLDVPLLIADINGSHLEIIRQQKRKGAIITNPNCSSTGLAMVLKPLHTAFGIEKCHVVTMQAISGAGAAAAKSMNIEDNVLPYIAGEEEKMEYESKKILGKLKNGLIQDADFVISSQCHRVNVSDGHTEAISVKLRTKAKQSDLVKVWSEYKSDTDILDLPTAPKQIMHYFSEAHLPQVKLQRNLDKGMALSIGRLQTCPILDYKFVILTHNTIRGAAGTAILNAELLVKKGYLK